MRYPAIACLLVLCAPASTLSAATAAYKFVGTPLTTHSGCLTSKDHIAMTLIFAKAIAKNTCSTSSPTSISFSDGLNKGSYKPAHFSGSFYLCTTKTGTAIGSWMIALGMSAKSGSADFTTGLYNGSGTSSQSVNDFECAGFGSGTASLAGKWTGP
jgi:hypothetical protein